MFEDELYINVDGDFSIVAGDAEEHFKKKIMKKGLAYTHDGQCYIYGGKLPDDPKSGHVYKSNKELVYVPAINPKMSSVDAISSYKKIIETVTDSESIKNNFDENNLIDLKIFAPPIFENDDPLKRSIKLALQSMQIDMRMLASKFRKEYDLSNLKSSVTKSNPMTMKYWIRWLEVLELDGEIIVKPKNNNQKLTEEIRCSIK